MLSRPDRPVACILPDLLGVLSPDRGRDHLAGWNLGPCHGHEDADERLRSQDVNDRKHGPFGIRRQVIPEGLAEERVHDGV